MVSGRQAPLLALLLSVALLATGTVAATLDEAKALLHRGLTSQAVESLDQVIAAEPDNYAAYFHRALAQEQLGRVNAAIRDLNSVIEKQPSFSAALLRRASLLLYTGNAKDARVDTTAYSVTHPSDPQLSELVHKISQFESLEAHLRHSIDAMQPYSTFKASLSGAIDLAPFSSSLRRISGEYEAKEGNHEMAAVEFQRVISLTPRDHSAYPLLAREQMLIGESTKATEVLQKCLELDPDYAPCKKSYRSIRAAQKAETQAQKLEASKSWEDLIKHVDDSLDKVHEDYPRQRKSLLLSRCRAFVKRERADDAIPACSAVIAMDDRNEQAYLLRGEAHLLNEDYDAATRDYSKVLEITPNHKEASEGQKRAQNGARNRPDYYKVLGVSRNAEKSEIKKAYRSLAQEWHPDKHTDKEKAQTKMAQINLAYEVLSDDEQRRQYDQGIDPNDPGGNQQQQHFHQGGPPPHFFQQFHFGGNGGGGQRQQGGGGFHFNFF